MLVDPSRDARAPACCPARSTILEAPVDEFWMRDHGPTFVVDDEPGGSAPSTGSSTAGAHRLGALGTLGRARRIAAAEGARSSPRSS
jgi:hypothetical protein